MSISCSQAPNPEYPIVLVDDDRNALHLMDMNFRVAGFDNIMLFESGREAREWISEHECDVIILDIIMPGESGVEILQAVKATLPDVPVIMATGVNEVDTAIACMKTGAFDYIVKPLEGERVVSSAKNALKLRQLQREYIQLSQAMMADELRNPAAFEPLKTKSPRILAIFRYIEAVSHTKYPVLITGETGSGKELFARAVHDSSDVSGMFVAVNVAGLDDNTFADTLFGHVKGAFTGAEAERSGLIETATDGTLLLDEIGDLSPQSQVKLLRVIQEEEYFPIGCDAPRKCSCRLIAATNRSIDELAASDTFRKDLYFRLRTHHIAIPPLRERKEDIPVLLDSFIEEVAAEQNKKKPSYPRELLDLLGTYSFPGNVRELQAMARNAVSVHSRGTLSMEAFRQATGMKIEEHTLRHSEGPCGSRVTFHETLPTLHEIQDELITEALNRSNGNQSIAAKLLGISRQSLSYRCKNMKQH
ncbi:MAG: response regulator [Chitinivibrionales bacterium]|nr:response regulator [Chitinivibrionales bacterium]